MLDFVVKSDVPWWPRPPSVGVHHTSDSGHTTRMSSARRAVAIVDCSSLFVRTEFIAGVLCCLAFQLLLLDHFPGGRWVAAHLADGEVWDFIFFFQKRSNVTQDPCIAKVCLELLTLLPLSPKLWNLKHVPEYPANHRPFKTTTRSLKPWFQVSMSYFGP